MFILNFIQFLSLYKLQSLMQQNSTWWERWLRSFIKYVTHIITGQTQIERISRTGDICAFQKSIKLSKILQHFREKYFNWQNQYHPDLAKELCALKQINNTDTQFRVHLVMEELHAWKHGLLIIQNLRSMRYDSQSALHQAQLLEIWTQLRSGRSIKSRKSNEWIQLGFQGDDPATDFRGAGVLGLVNLNGWVKTIKGKKVFKKAQNKETEYFFASASIFLTMLAFELLRDNKIGGRYWVPRQGQTVEALFQLLFQTVFQEFDLFWTQVSDKSMMQFNVNLLNFSKMVKNSKIGELTNKLIVRREKI